jgi:hypothetical protein
MSSPTAMPVRAREKFDARSEIDAQGPIAPRHECRSKPGRPDGRQVYLPETR